VFVHSGIFSQLHTAIDKGDDWLMPRYKDEQFDDVADIRTLQRQRTRETRPQAQQPRNLPQRGESTREDFYSDEHPEIPITRRASLYLDQYQSSSRLPVLRVREIDTEHTRRIPPDTEHTRRVPPLQKQKKPHKHWLCHSISSHIFTAKHSSFPYTGHGIYYHSGPE
jgi:hypothetical protein